MRKIAIANRKGGVGKTTTAVNISAGLALAGNTVLLIDTDSQNHCSKLLGVSPGKGLADLVEKQTPQEEIVYEARPNLYLIAGGKELGGTQRLIARKNFKSELVLSEALKPLEGKYDYCILDTAPGFNELSINVLFYANEVLIPVSMEILSVDGFIDFKKEIENIQQYADIEVKYIVPTFVDGRVKKTEQILTALEEHFSDKLTIPIHYNVNLSEAPGWGKTIYEYSKRSRASTDYAKLAGAIS